MSIYQELTAALHLIQEFGGSTIDTENGPLACNGGWCAEQARAALDRAKQSAKSEQSAVKPK